MKLCRRCNKVKEYFYFHKNKNRADGVQVYCKSCALEMRMDYYRRFKKEHFQYQKERADTLNEKIKTYLREHPCVDCGYSDIRALQFDHVRGKKEKNVSEMGHNGHSWATIMREISKCEVRCANCHSIATNERRKASIVH